jgi:hypothetical protein
VFTPSVSRQNNRGRLRLHKFVSACKNCSRQKLNSVVAAELEVLRVVVWESVNLARVEGLNQSEYSLRDFEPRTGEDLEAEPRWQLAQRIVASRSFAKSALLSRFLLYVCEREITGKLSEITEHQIGVHVFGRRPGYHPGEDNIVRNYARQLRLRLEQYFREEGRDEELCLTIPRGKYVPVYSYNDLHQRPVLVVAEPEAESTAQDIQPQPLPAATPVPPRRRSWWIAGVFAMLVGAFAVAWMMGHRASAASNDPSHRLWSQLFSGNRPTLIVPSDDGIVMIQNLTGHLVPLSEYIDRDYQSLKSPYHIDEQNMRDLDAQRYTNVTDLNATLRFAHLPEAAGGKMLVRYARDLRMEDLKDTNVVLLGSSFSNPWAELFEKNMNFGFSYQPHPNASVILNRKQQGDEPAVYQNDASGPSHRTYAVIAFLPNLNSTGWVLLAEGLTMAGTEAAVDTLFNPGAMGPLLHQFQNSDGSLSPFEVLIETRSFGSDSPQATVVATRRGWDRRK